jgi:hypothetical protein
VQMTEPNLVDYTQCVEVSTRIRWDIDRDVIRGRSFDFSKKFLPDAISRVDRLLFLTDEDRRLLSQIQGRTYANMFGLVERFISAKMLDITRDHWLGDQRALGALVRFTDEELKHQELFRRLEGMMAQGMPPGYRFIPEPNNVAAVVLGKSTWAVLGLICHIELFVLAHYRQSIEPAADSSELWKDVFLYHARDESQHAILDEAEWVRENAKLTPRDRDRALTQLIQLLMAVDGLLQVQARSDADYFAAHCQCRPTPSQSAAVHAAVLYAYRWQYIISGVQEPRFTATLSDMITVTQAKRLMRELEPIVQRSPAEAALMVG